MKEPIEIGAVPWTKDEMVSSLDRFAELYDRRPIRDNKGGMLSPHAFLAWFVLKKLEPEVIIESGVWLGQGTWILEQACPNAELHCIEPNLDSIVYRSKKAKYYDRDFSLIDWTGLQRDRSVIFFDDHQNAYERLRTCRWFGFKDLLFEDNYPPGRGDCYSLKKVLMHAGHRSTGHGSTLLARAISIGKAIARGHRGGSGGDVPANDVDEKYLRQNVEVYRELPPIYKSDKTRWGDYWTDENYPTPAPLLSSADLPYQVPYYEERLSFTWMCYAKLS